MEKTITAIELGSKKLKLVVGYALGGKVYSVYTLTKPYGPLSPDGRFFDFQKLVDTVSSIKELNDPNARFSTRVNDCVLCLPPDGVEIFQTKQRTPVISEHGKISPIDIRNLYSLIKNSSSKTSNILVDIVPETNHVILGSNDDLFTIEVEAKDFNLISMPDADKIISQTEEDIQLKITAKVRYRAQDTPGVITIRNDGTATMTFDEPVRAVTPGQSLVIYDGEYCLGGGIIVRR